MNRFKNIQDKRGSISVNESYEGERIETKIKRILTQGEPIKDGAPLIYTERKNGVMPEYNIRTDRWEVAVDAMDVVSKTTRAKRDNAPIVPIDSDKNVGGTESIEATNKD